jgi:hypothetical protein
VRACADSLNGNLARAPCLGDIGPQVLVGQKRTGFFSPARNRPPSLAGRRDVMPPALLPSWVVWTLRVRSWWWRESRPRRSTPSFGGVTTKVGGMATAGVRHSPRTAASLLTAPLPSSLPTQPHGSAKARPAPAEMLPLPLPRNVGGRLTLVIHTRAAAGSASADGRPAGTTTTTTTSSSSTDRSAGERAPATVGRAPTLACPGRETMRREIHPPSAVSKTRGARRQRRRRQRLDARCWCWRVWTVELKYLRK